MADIVLNVEVRKTAGTGGARAARREGLVPGVIYGGKKDPVAVAVRANEFRKALYTGKLLGHLVTAKTGSDKQQGIVKDVQFHPVTDEPWHFDLYRVDAHQLVKISVPIHFKNHEESPGLKRGGALNIASHDIELMAPADQIPEELVFDLTGLEIGDAIRISDIAFPAGIEPTADRESVVATVAGSSAQASEDAAADGETTEEAES